MRGPPHDDRDFIGIDFKFPLQLDADKSGHLNIKDTTAFGSTYIADSSMSIPFQFDSIAPYVSGQTGIERIRIIVIDSSIICEYRTGETASGSVFHFFLFLRVTPE